MLSPTGCIAHTGESYSKKPVMQVIGQQQHPIGTDAAKDTQMILNAYLEDLKTRDKRGKAISNIAIDVFLLGMIYGKREERRKRREKGFSIFYAATELYTTAKDLQNVYENMLAVIREHGTV